jgi:hypothetical protein
MKCQMFIHSFYVGLVSVYLNSCFVFIYLFINILVAHQLHTSKHNTSTHHDEQIEVIRFRSIRIFFVMINKNFSVQKLIGII